MKYLTTEKALLFWLVISFAITNTQTLACTLQLHVFMASTWRVGKLLVTLCLELSQSFNRALERELLLPGGGSFSLCKNGLVLSFSLCNSSLDSLVYRSLFLFLEVFGSDSTELEQVALVISLLSLVLLFEFISQLLFPLNGFFQLCFFQLAKLKARCLEPNLT